MIVRILLALKKHQQNFPDSLYYNSKIIFFLIKKKVKKNHIIPKKVHGEVSSTKVW